MKKNITSCNVDEAASGFPDAAAITLFAVIIKRGPNILS